MSVEQQPVSDKPEEPQASRLTTIVLIVSLVLVIVVAGVLAAVAVLMTRSPDAPLLGAVPPQQLTTPIHFAPVREAKPAPCPGEEAALDEQQATCYLLGKGVTVNAVQRIEAVEQNDGTYAVRIAIAPAFKERVSTIVRELVAEQKQLAVVQIPANVVVAAPTVTQAMDGDSLSIAPFGKAEAQALATRLGAVASPAPGSPTPGGTPSQGGVPSATPTTLPTTQPTSAPTTQPTSAPTAGSSAQPSTGASSPANVPVGQPTSLLPAKDKRYATCKEAVAHGLGPYTKGRQAEFYWYTDRDHNGVACNSGDL
ncbi:excalibur calcium-binding domain-containing protein [Nonomuraea sp. NBC_01738]|uniref:excalibur calcium-binding domain-containing protein n=1 Tax=Nonomuraea sp. NBC_01738 TaxID=2976003 RepID=UPI002E167806|nr:excalibur calcium-binding domain-containing protein [Nonomuraea sp. NBC_01738]